MFEGPPKIFLAAYHFCVPIHCLFTLLQSYYTITVSVHFLSSLMTVKSAHGNGKKLKFIHRIYLPRINYKNLESLDDSWNIW